MPSNVILFGLPINGETHYDSVFTRGFQFEPPSRPIPANQQAQPEPQGAQQSCTTHAVSDPASSVKSPEVVQLHLSHTLFPETNDPADAFNCTNANSWVFLTANVTSFSSQDTALLEIPFDIAAIQEARHTIKSQNLFSLTLKKAGFGVIWGKHQPFRAAKSSGHTSTGLNGRPGGVAVIARSHIPLQFIPPGDMEVRKRLYHSCRWVHAVATYGNCKRMIHIFSVYGFTGCYSHSQAAEKNESFLLDALEALAALGPDAPVLIMGDLNIEPHDSPVITEAISKGILVDLGAKCGPTFFPSQGRPRRLDAILAA